MKLNIKGKSKFFDFPKYVDFNRKFHISQNFNLCASHKFSSEYYQISSFQILTKDSVTIYVNAIMYYRVKVGGYSLLNISTIICYKHLFSQASYLPAHYRTEIFMDLG